MKILEENIKSEESRVLTVSIGKKKYIRKESVRGVEWFRFKTRHQVKKVEFELLEKEYRNTNPIHFSPASFLGIKPFVVTQEFKEMIF